MFNIGATLTAQEQIETAQAANALLGQLTDQRGIDETDRDAITVIDSVNAHTYTEICEAIGRICETWDRDPAVVAAGEHLFVLIEEHLGFTYTE